MRQPRKSWISGSMCILPGAGPFIQQANLPLSEIRNPEIFDDVIKMKYTVPNEDLSLIDDLHYRIDSYFDELATRYASITEVI